MAAHSQPKFLLTCLHVYLPPVASDLDHQTWSNNIKREAHTSGDRTTELSRITQNSLVNLRIYWLNLEQIATGGFGIYTRPSIPEKKSTQI